MRQIDAGSVQPFGGGNQMNDPKKMSVPVCCICQKVINGDAEWIRTGEDGMYMHKECVRKEMGRLIERMTGYWCLKGVRWSSCERAR